LADTLTKPLPPIKFKRAQNNLNVHDLFSRLSGRVKDQVIVAKIKVEDQENKDQ
jgi:hypothetical protein